MAPGWWMTFGNHLENYQQTDSSVKIPEALVPYMNGMPKFRLNNK